MKAILGDEAVANNLIQQANELLKEMNNSYPQIGFYSWLDLPIYNRIKEEYPPFNETIKNLKYPPLVSEQVELQW